MSEYTQQLEFIHDKKKGKNYKLLKGETKVTQLPYLKKNLFEIMHDPDLLGPNAQAIV